MDFLKDLKEAEKKDFQRIANKLISTCFICRKNDKKDYRFLIRHKKLFNEYFNICGYRLEENEEYGVFQLVNYEGHNRKLFNLNESIILLILRILYDEKKRELSLVNDAVITIGEIQDMYQAVRKGSKNITKTDLKNALATFRKYNIVGYDKLDFGGPFSLSEEDMPIIIYDSITMAVPIQDIKEVHKKLTVYETGQREEI